MLLQIYPFNWSKPHLIRDPMMAWNLWDLIVFYWWQLQAYFLRIRFKSSKILGRFKFLIFDICFVFFFLEWWNALGSEQILQFLMHTRLPRKHCLTTPLIFLFCCVSLYGNETWINWIFYFIGLFTSLLYAVGCNREIEHISRRKWCVVDYFQIF